MTGRVAEQATLSRAAQMILTADSSKVAAVWSVSPAFDENRQKAEPPSRPRSPIPFLHLASSLIGLFEEGGSHELLDNALIAVALAVQSGVDTDQAGVALQMLRAAPLAKPGVDLP